MKHLLYILTTILLLFTSCSSDNDTTIADQDNPIDILKTQSVLINIKTQSSTVTKSTSNDNELDLKKIIYAVFKIDENQSEDNACLVLLDSVKLNEGDTFSQIKFDLPTGNYVVKIFASGRADFSYLGFSHNALLRDVLIIIDNTSSPNEFIGSLDLVVANSPIDANVELNRAVGKVEIVITDLDKLPESVLSVSVHLESTTFPLGIKTWVKPSTLGLTSDLFTKYGNGDINVKPLSRENFLLHGEDNPIVFYTLQTGNSDNLGTPGIYSGGSLFLYLNDETMNNTILDNDSRKVLVSESLTVLPNKTSRFVGRVTGNEYGFSISVNQDWDSDTEVIELKK